MNETKPDDLIAAGVMGACCFLIGLVGVIGVIIWMMKGRSSPAPSAQSPQPYGAPQPVAPPVAAAEFHLSIVALAFDTYFRPQLENALTAMTPGADPVQQRVQLVQRAVKALLGIAPQWRHVGYGEKDLNDLGSAQQSYQSALADFRARAAEPADGGALSVLVLVLCTRGRRAGVTRLETRQQIHELLNDRLLVSPGSLLGAEVLLAPGQGSLSEPVARQRFPEMHVVAH